MALVVGQTIRNAHPAHVYPRPFWIVASARRYSETPETWLGWNHLVESVVINRDSSGEIDPSGNPHRPTAEAADELKTASPRQTQEGAVGPPTRCDAGTERHCNSASSTRALLQKFGSRAHSHQPITDRWFLGISAHVPNTGQRHRPPQAPSVRLPDVLTAAPSASSRLSQGKQGTSTEAEGDEDIAYGPLSGHPKTGCRGTGGGRVQARDVPSCQSATPSHRNPSKALERAEPSGDPLPSSSSQVASSRID